MRTRDDVTDECCGLPSQDTCGVFTRLNHHHLVDQHRRVVIDCARPGFKSCSLVVFVVRDVRRDICSRIRVFESVSMVVLQVDHYFMI